MAKFDYRLMKERDRVKLMNSLAKFIISLQSSREVNDFFNHFLSKSEQVMLGRRLQIAGALLREMSYQEIRQSLKVGISTIKSVEAWLSGELDKHPTLKKMRIERHVGRPETRHSSTVMLEDAIMRDSRFILFQLMLGAITVATIDPGKTDNKKEAD